MALLLALLLVQAPIDSLIRDLGHDSIEVRERAHRQLIEAGEAALPALEIAARSPDAELRIRAAIIFERVGREPRERAHDAAQKAALLLLRRDKKLETRPGSGASEGARFDVSAAPFEDGWIVSTRVTDYLGRCAEGPGRGWVTFEIEPLSGVAGRDPVVDRCGRCSPSKVFVKEASPPRVRITGDQVWFSPYHLEILDPYEGQRKWVGNFTIQVAGPQLRVTSDIPFPADWRPSMNERFEGEVRKGMGVVSERCGRVIG